jgi:hypothetical protein
MRFAKMMLHQILLLFNNIRVHSRQLWLFRLLQYRYNSGTFSDGSGSDSDLIR